MKLHNVSPGAVVDRGADIDRIIGNELKILKQGAILSCWLNRSFNELTKSQALLTASKKKNGTSLFSSGNSH